MPHEMALSVDSEPDGRSGQGQPGEHFGAREGFVRARGAIELAVHRGCLCGYVRWLVGDLDHPSLRELQRLVSALRRL